MAVKNRKFNIIAVNALSERRKKIARAFMIVHFRLLLSDESEEDVPEHRGGKGEGVVYYFVRLLGCDSELREWQIRERVVLHKNLISRCRADLFRAEFPTTI